MFEAREFEIYDIHNHIFPLKVAEKAAKAIGEFYETDMFHVGSSEVLLKSAKEVLVKKMLVCTAATVPEQTESINDFIGLECEKHEEFVGFGTLHPDNDNIEEIVDGLVEKGFKGIKLHSDFQKFNIDDEKADRIYSYVEGKLPILFHMGDDRHDYSRPYRLKNVLTKYPNLSAIAAHFGGYCRWEESVECLMDFDNIIFDTSSTLGFKGVDYVKDLIKKFDINKLAFGTDFPMWNHKTEVDMVLKLGLSFNDYEKIFKKNFVRFFNL